MQDPALGRWHSIDQLIDVYTDLSPYNYVNNNPVLNIDPDGRYYTNDQITEMQEQGLATCIYGCGQQQGGGSGSTDNIEKGDNKEKKGSNEGMNFNGWNRAAKNVGGPKDGSWDDTDYVEGAIIINEFGAFQYRGNGEFVDISFNPSISHINETGYIYDNQDLKIRHALFSNHPKSKITRLIQKLESRGDFVPLTSGNEIQRSGNNLTINLYKRYFKMMSDVTNPVKALNSIRGIKPRRVARILKSRASLKRRLTGLTGTTKVVRNRWNRFLKRNKGKFKGKYWLRDAQKEYRKQILNGR